MLSASRARNPENVPKRFVLTPHCEILVSMSYRVVDSSDKGKIAEASKNLLPGELLLKEKPLFFVSAEDSQRGWYRKFNLSESLQDFFVHFDAFMKRLSDKERARVFALYGPTSGRAAQGIRNEVATLFRFTPDHQFPLRGLTEKEKDMFVKFVRVMRFNMFIVDGGKALYEQITRFSHSCAPNCAFSFTGTEIACRAIKPIAAGEELTISYIPSRDAEPVHERRLDHLIGKEFTCHCPRCDAPGDDTRQFDCFDPACRGVMMVCQPLNQKPIRIPDLCYTGVEYVEPHLLPCTVCHRAAPTEYQTRIFKVEAVLSDLAAVATRDFAKLPAPGRQADVEALLRDIPPFPRRHAACWPVLMVQAKCYGLLNPSYRTKLAGVVRECIASMESVFPNPNDETCGRLMEICGLFCSPGGEGAVAEGPPHAPDPQRPRESGVDGGHAAAFCVGEAPRCA